MNRQLRNTVAFLFSSTLGALGPTGAATAADHHLLLAGQVMLQNNLAPYTSADDASPALQKIRRELAEVFAVVRRNDAVVLELETALTVGAGKGAATEPGRDKDSDFFHEIDGAGVTDLIRNQMRLANTQVIFAAANNHVSDNGAAGIAAMRALFDQLQVPLAGVGFQSDASAARYQTIARDGGPAQKVALVAFATDKVKLPARQDAIGVNTLTVDGGDKNLINAADEQRIFASLDAAHRNQATVIAYQHNHHWNQQKVNEAGGVEKWRIDFAHQCIEHGADVYFAHGEPRLQGIEIYRGKPIFYGLGNFVFQTRKVNFYQSEVWESVIAELEYGDPVGAEPRRLKAIKLIPVVLNEAGSEPAFFQTRGLPAIATGARAKSILLKLQAQSRQYGTRMEINERLPDAAFGRISLLD
jgi:poly-gamma-glutamate synthesis protein (capsule biosynthesis protein)